MVRVIFSADSESSLPLSCLHTHSVHTKTLLTIQRFINILFFKFPFSFFVHDDLLMPLITQLQILLCCSACCCLLFVFSFDPSCKQTKYKTRDDAVNIQHIQDLFVQCWKMYVCVDVCVKLYVCACVNYYAYVCACAYTKLLVHSKCKMCAIFSLLNK